MPTWAFSIYTYAGKASLYMHTLCQIAAKRIPVYMRHHDKNLIRQAHKHMAGRPRRSPVEFGRSFYPRELQDIAAVVIKALDETVKVDLAQVEPTDRMETDLKLGSLDSLLMIDLRLRLEREFDVKFDKGIFDQPGEGVDGLIRIVATALKETKESGGEREENRAAT